MEVTVGISNKHVHLSEDVYKLLFKNQEFNKLKDLAQPGEYASDKKITIKTNKAEIENVRVLGPFRPYTQIEIAKTDAIKLGINPPVRNSGDLEGSESVTLVSDFGEVTLERGCIIAARHIHITPSQMEEFGLKGLTKVSVRVKGDKSGILNDVYLKVAEKSYFEIHLDTDDGNAFLLNQGSVVEIINEH